MSESDARRQARLANLARLAKRGSLTRSPHWEWWREPVTPERVACVACGAHLFSAGEQHQIPEYRALPLTLRPQRGQRPASTMGDAGLITCPGCHEIHEVRITLKAA